MREVMTHVWFGPPGVGKSTFVKKVGGFDLETLNTRGERKATAAKIGGTIANVGAADTAPDDYDRSKCVLHLVLPPRDVYDKRRADRDAARPDKADQPDCYDSFASGSSKFDDVVADFPSASPRTEFLPDRRFTC